MRVLELRAPCALSAAAYWALRDDPGWDAYNAACDGQDYVVEAARRDADPAGGARVRRLSRLVQAWPRALLALLGVTADELRVLVETAWHTRDPAGGCAIAIAVPLVGDRFRIAGRLWAEPGEGGGCVLRTSYVLDVRAPWPFAAQVEAAAAAAMRRAYADQPRRAAAYAAATRVRRVAAPSPGSVRVPPALVRVEAA